MPAIELRSLVKTFGATRAVDGVDLVVDRGEFFTMLGASGSGKTTMLRVIAGFEAADSGIVLLHGRDVTRLPPYQRPVNTVFQDYALFPHMSVRKNVEYGLRVKGVGTSERKKKADAVLEMVGLGEMGKRRPSQLSGGQRQRVALARALVNEPDVLLLDEPLGALDLKLRQEMQLELKRVQREAGITFVFVTHDQEEALTMSDRIAVFHNGKIDQVGTPAEIYESPSTAYVADFIGVSNVLAADGQAYAVRPERIDVLTTGDSPRAGAVVVPGVVTDVIYLGMVTRYHVTVEGGQVINVARQNTTRSGASRSLPAGSRVQLAWYPEDSQPLADPSAASDSGNAPQSPATHKKEQD
ncbi:MAG TPA: ABC transporter ATP-binding protein [Marmoricola sp.]|nr:ABC transporter ATP-binding protein [Marmoricola sp.]